jgi:hypothetical protein
LSTSTTQKKVFSYNAKQRLLFSLIAAHTEILAAGGARSGKTFALVDAVLTRAFTYPKTRHLIIRKHFNHIKASIWYQTIPEVLQIVPDYQGHKLTENKTDWFYQLQNGSTIWIAGSDDKERVEKILGTEWATIYLNEASQLSFDIYDLLKTRLNPPKGVPGKLLIDYNPPNRKHWGYRIFEEGVHPETGVKLKNPDRYGTIRMNPHDNRENLSDGYIETLESMSEQKRRRFLLGEYTDDNERALWKSEWVYKNRLDKRPENIHRCVVAVDPNVTDDKKVNSQTDEAGIITVGEFKLDGENHYCVIADDSTPGLSWGAVACDVYHREAAGGIVAEVNQGGDLVEMNIRNYDRNVKYDAVRATRGKEVRAEPVADLYRRGYVHHIGEFPELEDELTSWVPGEGRSPNRLDALVWGIAFLSGNMQQIVKPTMSLLR